MAAGKHWARRSHLVKQKVKKLFTRFAFLVGVLALILAMVDTGRSSGVLGVELVKL